MKEKLVVQVEARLDTSPFPTSCEDILTAHSDAEGHPPVRLSRSVNNKALYLWVGDERYTILTSELFLILINALGEQAQAQ